MCKESGEAYEASEDVHPSSSLAGLAKLRLAWPRRDNEKNEKGKGQSQDKDHDYVVSEGSSFLREGMCMGGGRKEQSSSCQCC